MGQLPASHKGIPITHILTKEWIHFFHRLNILRDSPLMWGAICLLLENMSALFYHRSSLPVMIYFSMLMAKKVFGLIQPTSDIADTLEACILY